MSLHLSLFTTILYIFLVIMSYNPNFYNNFTFQNDFRPPELTVPPPPLPPMFIQPYAFKPKFSDQEFIKSFEAKLTNIPKKTKPKSVSISQVREQLRNIVTILKNLEEKEAALQNSMDTLSEEQWTNTMDEIKRNRVLIEGLMIQINDTYLDVIKNALAKRSAKRLRLKRLCVERKRQKEEMRKNWAERSRQIDEHLQQIKDGIIQAKLEQESKIQADIILKDVTRKKHDAKKCITKLDALIKLRKARQNTAKGSGLTVSENEAASFNNNIDKLKSMWNQKLSLYEKEERELRATLKENSKNQNMLTNDAEKNILENLAKWREFLFGSNMVPQVDFKGDIGEFVVARSNWDQYINSDGSPLPVGWVIPT